MGERRLEALRESESASETPVAGNDGVARGAAGEVRGADEFGMHTRQKTLNSPCWRHGCLRLSGRHARAGRRIHGAALSPLAHRNDENCFARLRGPRRRCASTTAASLRLPWRAQLPSRPRSSCAALAHRAGHLALAARDARSRSSSTRAALAALAALAMVALLLLSVVDWHSLSSLLLKLAPLALLPLLTPLALFGSPLALIELPVLTPSSSFEHTRRARPPARDTYRMLHAVYPHATCHVPTCPQTHTPTCLQPICPLCVLGKPPQDKLRSKALFRPG